MEYCRDIRILPFREHCRRWDKWLWTSFEFMVQRLAIPSRQTTNQMTRPNLPGLRLVTWLQPTKSVISPTVGWNGPVRSLHVDSFGKEGSEHLHPPAQCIQL